MRSMQKPSYLSRNVIRALVSIVTVWSNILSITYGSFCENMRIFYKYSLNVGTADYSRVKFSMTTLFSC